MKVRNGYLFLVTVDSSTGNMPAAGLHKVGTNPNSVHFQHSIEINLRGVWEEQMELIVRKKEQ